KRSPGNSDRRRVAGMELLSHGQCWKDCKKKSCTQQVSHVYDIIIVEHLQKCSACAPVAPRRLRKLGRLRQITHKEKLMIEGLLQPTHLLVILAVAIFVLGPKKLPELGKGLAEGIRSFQKGIKDATEPEKKA